MSGERTRAIEDEARKVIARDRLADVIWGLGAVAFPVGLLLASASVALIRLAGLSPATAWITVAPVPAILIWAAFRPRRLRPAIRRIDRHFDLHDQLGLAYELDRDLDRDRDPRTRAVAELAIDRALPLLSRVEARAVVTMPRPRPRRIDALALALLGASFLLPRLDARGGEIPTATPDPDRAESLATRQAEALDLTLAEPLREQLRGLVDGADTPAAIAAEITEIFDALERGELDRAAALARLEALEQKLAEAELAMEAAVEEDPWTLAEAMRRLAEALERHELTEEAARALKKSDAEGAQQALEAAMASANEDPAKQAAMDRALADAERSLAESANSQRDTAAALAEAERRLKREQKQKEGESEDPEARERRLQRQQDRVDQLRRQHEAEKRAQEALDRLRRQARDARGKGRGGEAHRQQGQQKLSQGTGDAARKSSAARRMSSARDALEEAKSFVRRAGSQGDREQRRKKQQASFGKAARGERGEREGKKGPSMLVEGEVGEGQPDAMMIDPSGQGGQDGQGQDGQGQGQDGQGQDGQGQDGQGQGQDGRGQGQGLDGQGQGLAAGEGMGEGRTDALGEDESSADAAVRDLRVDARHGQGATRAQVIRDSSQSGFATQSYRRVFTDYRAFAQSALDDEQLPPAQRRRVKRYFQLIQPRDRGETNAP